MIAKTLAAGLMFCCYAVADSPAASPANVDRGDPERIVDLRGTWMFKLGDESKWADPRMDESDWESIFVPSKWEEEGYWGYDGYAWYRKHFTLDEVDRGRAISVDVGRIDDVSAVYVNGWFVGNAGRFPPNFETAYYRFSRYRVPDEYLNWGGDNVIAIRVYDQTLEGGLIEGRPGIYAETGDPTFAVDLGGPWKLKTGDRSSWRDPGLDDENWDNVTVPAMWEAQGYAWYDGYAWYRKHFYVPKDLDEQEYTLILGKIDDLDETFLNGHRIGGVGAIDERRVEGYEWQVVRTYDIPEGLLKRGEENVIAVRVYDGMGNGGLFEGSVGIVARSNADAYRRQEEQPFSFWRWLFDLLDQ